MMIAISWIRWHIYNFVVCKYNDNKQSESESESFIMLISSDLLIATLSTFYCC